MSKEHSWYIMRHLAFLVIVAGLNFPGYGQVGVSGSYTWFKADPWEEAYMGWWEGSFSDYEESYFFQNGYQVGIDYWMRLKDVRIEFYPELRFARFQAAPVSSLDEGLLKWDNFSFHWTTNVYPFDFFGDCDCPTFSKQDPIFKKGLFLQLSPGVHLLRESYWSEKQLILIKEKIDLAYSVGLGAGLDVGLSDWITISPYGRISRLFDGSWEGFADLPFLLKGGEGIDGAVRPYALWIPEAGIHLGIRWNH